MPPATEPISICGKLTPAPCPYPIRVRGRARKGSTLWTGLVLVAGFLLAGVIITVVAVV